MKVYNYGSINIDHIYRVIDFVRPGETLASKHYHRMLGGKGANQSIALSKAGTTVQHIGSISTADDWIRKELLENGISTDLIKRVEDPTGHAIIQVSDAGENAILLYGGANQSHLEDGLTKIFSDADKGDWLLLQNECNLTGKTLKLAKDQGMIVAFNPAPMTDEVRQMPLDCVDYLIVNETETEGLVNDSDYRIDQPQAMLDKLHSLYPHLKIVMTLGGDGVIYKDSDQNVVVVAEKVEVVDTTAAGDTFIGYFIQQIIEGNSVETALKVANKASSITVQTLGASESIPDMKTLKSSGLVN